MAKKTNSQKKKHGSPKKAATRSQTRKAKQPALPGEVALKDVLRDNGEDHLHDKIFKLKKHADEEPPLIFHWKLVGSFVDATRDAYSATANGGAAVPAPPFHIPEPLTRDSFKRAILSYSQVGTAGPYGLTCLPCGYPELTTAAVRLERFDRHPWTQHIIAVGGAQNVLPVGDLLVFKKGTGTLVPAREPLSTSVWNH